MSHTKWMLIGRGKAGWHADGSDQGNKVSGSGGDLEGYCLESENGTIVYDADDADTGAFVRWVMSGPMLDVCLSPGKVSQFGEDDKDVLARILPGLDGAYKTMGLMALLEPENPNKIGGYDFVALDVYLSLFKAAVPGVRWGMVQNGKVVWSND